MLHPDWLPSHDDSPVVVVHHHDTYIIHYVLFSSSSFSSSFCVSHFLHVNTPIFSTSCRAFGHGPSLVYSFVNLTPPVLLQQFVMGSVAMNKSDEGSSKPSWQQFFAARRLYGYFAARACDVTTACSPWIIWALYGTLVLLIISRCARFVDLYFCLTLKNWLWLS